MRFSFEQRLERAAILARQHPAAREILDFCARLTRFQKRIFEQVSARGETRVESLVEYFPSLLELLRESEPPGLAEAGEQIADRAMLLEACWTGEAHPHWFFGRALVQPFAESPASRGQVDREHTQMICPFCSSNPAVAARRAEGDGGKRSLICSLCSTEWT